MTKLLVKFDTNWADEMEIKGWSVFYSERAWEDWKDCIPNRKFSIYFGSNQDNEYTREEFLKCFKVFDITDTDADTLERLFGGSDGRFPDPPDPE
jgi:hypothetical protein